MKNENEEKYIITEQLMYFARELTEDPQEAIEALLLATFAVGTAFRGNNEFCEEIVKYSKEWLQHNPILKKEETEHLKTRMKRDNHPSTYSSTTMPLVIVSAVLPFCT
jgi:hypothetical protein